MKTDKIPHTPRNGLIARVAIQCDCPDTGLTGTFLYSGESHKNKQSRVTPVFDDLVEMFTALNAPGSRWEAVSKGDCSNGYIFKG